ncbi:hypothetical protein KKD52_17735, partial [Myxococcota bacterium]|nr:hypothetical protein [Myxococcota bacterium]
MKRITLSLFLLLTSAFVLSSCIVQSPQRTSDPQPQPTNNATNTVEVTPVNPIVEPAEKLVPPPLPSVEPEVIAETVIEEVDESIPDSQPESMDFYTDTAPPAGYEESPAILPPEDVVEVMVIPPDYAPPQFSLEDLIPPNYSYCSGGSFKRDGKCLCPRGTGWHPRLRRCMLLTQVFPSYCKAGSVWDGRRCVCPANTFWNPKDRWCRAQAYQTCPGGSVWTGRNCACSAGKFWDVRAKRCVTTQAVNCTRGTVPARGNKCVCPAGRTWDAQTRWCVVPKPRCPAGTVLQDNRCVCPSGTHWDARTNACTRTFTCPGGMQLTQVGNHSVCRCPANTYWNAGTKSCINKPFACKNGTVWINNRCECPANTFWNAQTRSCSAGQMQCPGGSVWQNGTCRCAAGFTWNAMSRSCVASIRCPGNMKLNGSRCECPAGTYFNKNLNSCRTVQTCAPGSRFDFVSDTCIVVRRCAPTQTLNPRTGQCECANGTYWNTRMNQCRPIRACNGRQFFDQNLDRCVDGRMTCVGGQVQVGNACACRPNFYWNEGMRQCRPVRACPPNSTFDQIKDTCVSTAPKCVGGQILVGNACQCKPNFYWNAGKNQCRPIRTCPPNSSFDQDTDNCVSTAPKCVGGQILVGNACQCKPNFYWNAGKNQ